MKSKTNHHSKDEDDYFIDNKAILKQVKDKNLMVSKDISHHKQLMKNVIYYIDDKYQGLKISGYPIYSILFSAFLKDTKKKVNIRYYNKIRLGEDYDFNLFLEIQLLSFFNHENIVKIIDLSYPLFNNSEIMYDVTESMDTDLRCIIQSQQELTDQHIQYFMYQILRALHYVHSAKVICFKLEPSTIQINANCDIKLSNFKMSRSIFNNKINDVFLNFNTGYYAPEIYIRKNCNQKSDIWSVGCILAELLNRRKLFDAYSLETIIIQHIQFCGTPTKEELDTTKNIEFQKMVRSKPHYLKQSFKQKFPNANPQALDLLDKMLQFDSEKRFNALECLQHQYLKEFYDPQYETICDTEFDWSFYENNKDKLSNKDYLLMLYKQNLYFSSR